VPRLVEVLVGKKVIGATAGVSHTATRTEAGELFTFGHGGNERLGHGGEEHELVPRLGGTHLAAAAADEIITLTPDSTKPRISWYRAHSRPPGNAGPAPLRPPPPDLNLSLPATPPVL